MVPAELRIVVADDNRDAVAALSRLLKLKGYNVVATAFDGQAALEAIRRERPNVALLDLGMPGLRGEDVARQVRSEPNPPMLVAITGWSNHRERQVALDAGFHEHLAKPASLTDLEAILSRCLSS